MITTQKEKAFAGELKELMRKHGVRIEEDKTENYEESYEEELITDTKVKTIEIKMNHKFVGPDIDVLVEDFELWRNVA